MCLSVPAVIVKISGDEAKVSISGNLYAANISLLEDVKVGDYILLHAGFGIQKISDEEAGKVLGLLREMRSRQ